MASVRHLDQIAENGYCVLQDVIPAVTVDAVRDSVLATAAAHKTDDPRSRLDKVSGMINVDQSFAPYLVEPRLLGLCQALLGEQVRVSFTTCMITHPGNERGVMHADWPFNQGNAGHLPAPYPDAVVHLTTIWMLTPFTADNGTLIVPGSHRRSDNPTGDVGLVAERPHADEIAVEGPAGSVLVMDSRLWHAIGPNRSDGPRVALPIRFAPWWLNLDSLCPGSDERERLTAAGQPEPRCPRVPAAVFAALSDDVKPLFRHWVAPS
jgi:hypothetical protein